MKYYPLSLKRLMVVHAENVSHQQLSRVISVFYPLMRGLKLGVIQN